MEYAVIKDGQVVERRFYEKPFQNSAVGVLNEEGEIEIKSVSPIKHIDGLPMLRPIEVVIPEFNPETQIKERASIEIFDDKVVETWIVRDKTEEEIASEKSLIKEKLFQGSFQRVVESYLLELENRVRKLEKKPEITPEKLRMILESGVSGATIKS